jgi:hypothetical protein
MQLTAFRVRDDKEYNASNSGDMISCSEINGALYSHDNNLVFPFNVTEKFLSDNPGKFVKEWRSKIDYGNTVLSSFDIFCQEGTGENILMDEINNFLTSFKKFVEDSEYNKTKCNYIVRTNLYLRYRYELGIADRALEELEILSDKIKNINRSSNAANQETTQLGKDQKEGSQTAKAVSTSV